MIGSIDIKYLLLLLIVVLLSSCHHNASGRSQRHATAMLSLATNGNYVVSSHYNGHIILWNLLTHRAHCIANNGNIYSPYFIKDSPYFMWQSINPRKITYAAMAGKPSLSQLADVANRRVIILSQVNGHPFLNDGVFYLYFSDKKTTLGYSDPRLDLHYTIKVWIDILAGHNNGFYQHIGVEHYISNISLQMKILNLAIQMGYQSKSNVYVQNIDGAEILKFNNFPVYGQVMYKDLTTYVAADFNWDVYNRIGKSQQLMMIDQDGMYWGKLLNLSITSNGKYVLTAGSAASGDNKHLYRGKNEIKENTIKSKYGFHSRTEGVVLWNTQTNLPVKKFVGNDYQTYATISPNGLYIVAADINAHAYIWNLATGIRTQLWSLFNGKVVAWDKSGLPTKWTKKGLVDVPHDFRAFLFNNTYDNKQYARKELVFCFKFIDATHYLRFNYYVPYAILYQVNDPKPIKYFKLSTAPYPAFNNYMQDEAIDSSPSSHILVIAQSNNSGGIIEYKYNPIQQTLDKIWVSNRLQSSHINSCRTTYGQ